MTAGTRVGIALAAALSLAGWIVTSAAGAPRILGSGAADEPPQLQVVSTSASGMQVEFTLPALSVEELQVGDEIFQSVTIPGGGDTGALGAPALPTCGRFVLVPDRSGVTVTATVQEEEEVAGYRLVPMQDEEATTFAYDAPAYARVGYGNEPWVKAGEPALLGGLRVVPISIAPVQYDPSRGTLKIARRMTVEVTYAGEDLRNTPTTRQRPVTPSFDNIYRRLVLGYTGPIRGQEVQRGTYLIICPNDAAVISRLQPLVDWRQRQGLPVKLATTAETGTSETAIKAYIQDAYDYWTIPPEYVVLAADAGGSYSLPTWYENLSGYGGEGDHPYTQLAGNDVLSDIHLGRLSFGTLAELETIVAKTVGYESTPYMTDTAWYTRACLVGDPDASGYSTVQVQQWIKTRLLQLGYAQVDTIFSGNFVSQMSTALNRGDTMFCYRGYYQMSGWGNSNTNALTNGWKMPFACISTCGTGSFAGGTARSEQFLRAGTATTPKAAVGSIGTATTGTHTRYNNCYTFGVFWGMLDSGASEMGVAHTWGKLNLFLNYQATQPNWVTIFSYWNNLMGDPACAIWTAVPAPVIVSHTATLPVGANSFAVTATEGGEPDAGALVSLYRTVTGGTLQVTGTTDDQGRCELAIPPAEAGTFKLTVTKHNRQPYLTNLPVTAQSVFVAYQASTIDDDDLGESQGDGDGIVNPGETIELPVQLRNFGTLAANSVTAAITTDDPFATITDGAETFGNLAGGAAAWCADDFGFSVRGDCPHGHLLRFGLDATSGSSTWHSVVEIPVVAADLQHSAHAVSNAGSNGIFDPGETVTLTVTLRNDGGITAGGLTATLLSRSEYLDIPVNTAVYPAIPPGLSHSNGLHPFTVHATPDCPGGQPASLRLVLAYNDVMSDTVDFSLTVGQRDNADPIGPDGYGYYAYDNTDLGYPETPVYNWIEIDPNLGGSGTQVTLGDYADYQDKSKAVTLPFSFNYYGQGYTTATICSNGWVVMGSTYLTDYRNWTIPSPGGPNGVIAAFWDDLIEVNSPAGHVYQQYDPANHVWIVEWSRMRNIVGSATETVQAIFYDPIYHPTETGDGMILFQYKTVSNPDATDGYATVGIEKPDNSDGLLYTYFNQYPVGAPALAANRAILFVPKKESLTGLVSGTVRNASSGGSALAGATVVVLENGHQYTSGLDGTFQGSELTGIYTLVASRDGFAPDTVGAVNVPAGGTVTPVLLLDDIVAPVVSVVQAAASTTDTLVTHPIRISVADMSMLSEISLHYRGNQGPFQTIAMVADGPGFYRGEIPAQHWTTRIDYYVVVRDGGGNTTTLPTGAPDALYRFWVGPLLTVWQDNLETDTGWTVGSPGDDATAGIWERVDPNGTWNGEIPVQPEDDHTAEPGVTCWVTGNAPVGADQDANDVDGGLTTLVSPRINCAIDGMILLRYWRWYSNNTPGVLNDVWVAQVSNDDGVSWTDLERTARSNGAWLLREFDLSTFVTPTSQVRVRFLASDYGAPSIVEAAVDDIEIVCIGLTPSGVNDRGRPRFGFAGAMANPVRPGSQVLFSLDRAASVKLEVYDIQGRCLQRLFEGALPVGTHTSTWSGRDRDGHLLPGGLYFHRLSCEGRTETRKVLLVH
jgi:hypothetical protein